MECEVRGAGPEGNRPDRASRTVLPAPSRLRNRFPPVSKAAATSLAKHVLTDLPPMSPGLMRVEEREIR